MGLPQVSGSSLAKKIKAAQKISRIKDCKLSTKNEQTGQALLRKEFVGLYLKDLLTISLTRVDCRWLIFYSGSLKLS